MNKPNQQQRERIYFFLVCTLLGLAADFLFNGVAVRALFRQFFKEQWAFIYIPLDLALVSTLITLLHRSRWTFLANRGGVAFVCGIIVGHLIFIGHHVTRNYSVIQLSDSNYVLLRSNTWPQILFIEGDEVRKKLLQNPSGGQVPVTMEMVTDYGCIRTAVVSTVAGIDVKEDVEVRWTWRMNERAKTPKRAGPGMEDRRFPWCKHINQIKVGTTPTSTRPWDELLEKSGI